MIGLSAGLAALAFHMAMNGLAAVMVVAPSKASFLVFAAVVPAAMFLCAWLTGWMIQRFAPDAPGSGIPQVKRAYHEGRLDFTWKLVVVKFLGGVLSIGSGSSLGREGPTIHIGAALASKIGKWLGEGPDARANAVCAGSAAGLAAAFGSPLAGVTLVLEEIAGGRHESRFAGRALLAAALAATVVGAFTSGVACLPVGPDDVFSWRTLWLSPVVAFVAGGAGLAFQAVTLGLRRRSAGSILSKPLQTGLGALTGGVVCVAAFGLTGRLGGFGLGEEDLLGALTNQVAWQAAAILLAAKLVATAACYGTGGCGGIFAPILFFGAMAGVCSQTALGAFVPLDDTQRLHLVLVGMTACLGAVVRAPLTSILIVVEMTWQFHALPALMIAAVIGAWLNRLCFAGNFYDAALKQDGVVLNDE